MEAPSIDIENAKEIYDYWEQKDREFRDKLRELQEVLRVMSHEYADIADTFSATRAFYARHLGVENPHSYQPTDSTPASVSWDTAIRSSRVQNGAMSGPESD